MDQILYTLITVLVAIPLGWLGGSLRYYFNEKGKNLATKEDIEQITSLVESVKSEFSKNIYKSSALIDRQIQAFDTIFNELAELQVYCLREIQKENEHAVPYEMLPPKSTFQRSVHIQEIAHKYRIYISQDIFLGLGKLAQEVFNLATIELHTKLADNIHHKNVRQSAKRIQSMIGKEIFGHSFEDEGPALYQKH